MTYASLRCNAYFQRFLQFRLFSQFVENKPETSTFSARGSIPGCMVHLHWAGVIPSSAVRCIFGASNPGFELSRPLPFVVTGHQKS